MAFTTPQGRTSTSLSEINVTPLVDVMLVLLVIFMVTAPMLQTGIDVELPETRNVANENPEQRIVLSISRDGFIYYGSESINFSTIGERLKKDATRTGSRHLSSGRQGRQVGVNRLRHRCGTGRRLQKNSAGDKRI